MEVIDRYIYAVTQRLPEQQREDIKRELQSLIEDMLEERISTGQASKEDVESVLLELGHPNELAVKYRGNERYLIGPMLIDTYLTTLKIVLASIIIGLTAFFHHRYIPFAFGEARSGYKLPGLSSFGCCTRILLGHRCIRMDGL
jgi:hypothetical protein